MGTLSKSSYTMPIPAGSKIKNGVVSWITKGKPKTGKLSGADKVLVESEVWIARFIDENGETKKISTKTKNHSAAMRMLVKLEDEVVQIRAGVLKRSELVVSKSISEPITKHLDAFCLHKIACGVSDKQVESYKTMLPRMFSESGIETLQDIDAGTLDEWIIYSRNDATPKSRSARTINSYFDRLRTFCLWCVETGRMSKNPTEKIKDQNEEIDKRKQRRSLTPEEIDRLLVAARTRPRQRNGKSSAEEVEIAYRTILGTGLRSSELASLMVYQIDCDHRIIDLKPIDTKNKKGGKQPITENLAMVLRSWIAGKKPKDKVFQHDADSLMSSFRRDCRAAGIELMTPDGRSIDVHSLRRTFGTMLARAGVPLTTTQKLMRHSSPELTAKLYIDVEPIDMQMAVEKLAGF